jgi:hypothetical protein
MLPVVCATSFLSAGVLGAQLYPNHLKDRWELTLSGATVVLASEVRVDGETQGTTINVERILGLDKNKIQPRLAVAWRPGRRHQIEVGYQFVRRDAEKILTQQFTFRDSTYRVGERIRTSFDSDQLFVNYRWAFKASDRSEFGLGLGLGALLFDIGLDVLAGTSGGSSVQFARSKSFTVPSGSLGFYGKWAFGARSYVDADARAVKIDVSSLNATIYESGLGYRFFFTPRFGAETGYGISWYDLHVTTTKSDGSDVFTFVKYSLQNIRLGIVTTL